jgi:hypothetical protein
MLPPLRKDSVEARLQCYTIKEDVRDTACPNLFLPAVSSATGKKRVLALSNITPIWRQIPAICQRKAEDDQPILKFWPK